MPGQLNFGYVPKGYFGGQLSGSVYSPGSNSGPVSFSSITIQGNVNFIINSKLSNCNSTLSRGGLCSVTIEFDPTRGGSGQGQLVFTDNASNSPQVILLNGE